MDNYLCIAFLLLIALIHYSEDIIITNNNNIIVISELYNNVHHVGISSAPHGH